jgi:hypothetical protein
MNKNWSGINQRAKLLAASLAIGALISGCGGGGSGSTAAGTEATAVSSYIADQQTGSSVGSWSYVGGASSVVSAGVNTLAATATANTYTSTYADKLLSGGVWGVDPNPVLIYDLKTSGWALSPNTGTFVDSGDGSHITITPTGDVGVTATITKTSLAGTPIACTSPTTGATVTCMTPGNYPAGAASYQSSYSGYLSDRYYLLASADWGPVTDETGTTLTVLPTVGATICHPYMHTVWKAITPTPAVGADNYNVHGTMSCSAVDIATATATAAYATVLISNLATGNAVVPNVLNIQASVGSPMASMNNSTFGLRAGNVWYGWMSPAGSVGTSTSYNKTAMNAKLLASGLVALP